MFANDAEVAAKAVSVIVALIQLQGLHDTLESCTEHGVYSAFSFLNDKKRAWMASYI